MKIPKLKNLFKDENKTKIIGLLTILIGLWLVLYFIPEIFVSLFNSLLGNLILIIVVLLVFLNNKIYGLLIGLIIIILFRFYHLSKEGFTPQSENEFIKLESQLERYKVFDMKIINQQASQEELDFFNENGVWPWSQEVLELYREAKKSNPYVRSFSGDVGTYTKKVYNEAAILRALSYQTKEGQFLLNGVLVENPNGNEYEELPNGFGNFPYDSGLLENRVDDVIKCNLVKDDNNPSLERIRYTGKGGIFGQQTKKIEEVDYNDLENIIPGFKFLSSPCDPCKSMGAIPDYSCPFSLQVEGENPSVSNVWKYLWGIK
jgi:hypothetical protein